MVVLTVIIIMMIKFTQACTKIQKQLKLIQEIISMKLLLDWSIIIKMLMKNDYNWKVKTHYLGLIIWVKKEIMIISGNKR